jgi:hypothetical protein
MDQIVKKLPDILNRAGPGKELLMAQAYGLDKLFPDQLDMLRLATREGQKQYEMQRQLVEKYKDQLKISDRAQIAWTEFYVQLQAAGAQIESFFGEKLADLAPPLRHLSEGFTHIIKALMDAPEVQKIIKRLSDWIDDLAKKMQKLSTEDVNNFIKKIEEWLPTLDQVESALTLFVNALKWAVEALDILSKAHPFSPSKAATAFEEQRRKYQEQQGIIKPGEPAKKGIFEHLWDALTGKKSEDQQTTTTPPQSTTTSQTTTAPKATSAPAPTASPTATSASVFQAGASPFNTFGAPQAARGGGLGAPSVPGAGQFGWQNTINNAAAPALGTLSAANKAMSPSPASSGGGLPSWSAAAAKLTPKAPGQGAFGRLGGQELSSAAKSQRGPLSVDNWQMNRTTSLVVRNVPGANMFMTAAGMTG